MDGFYVPDLADLESFDYGLDSSPPALSAPAIPTSVMDTGSADWLGWGQEQLGKVLDLYMTSEAKDRGLTYENTAEGKAVVRKDFSGILIMGGALLLVFLMMRK